MDIIIARLINLPQSAQRAVAVVVAFAVLALLGITLALATEHLLRKSAELQSVRQSLGNIERTVAVRDHLERQLRDGVSRQHESLFLTAPSAASGRSQLQEKLGAIAAAGEAAEIVSAGNARDLVRDGISYIGLSINLIGAMQAVHATIIEIETAVPPLFIKSASVRSSTEGFNQDAQEVVLTAQLSIYAAFQVETPQSSQPSAARLVR